jgi:hypothetical protein
MVVGEFTPLLRIPVLGVDRLSTGMRLLLFLMGLLSLRRKPDV